MKNFKYPTKLFVFGFIFCVIIYNFFLFVPAVILIIVGIWNKICYYIGCLILLVDLVLSFIKQIRIRSSIIESTNEELENLKKAISDETDLKEFVEKILDEDDDEEH